MQGLHRKKRHPF